MSENHYIIVGGGLAGASSFYELVSRGQACTLVDAHPGPGLGTSFANGAVLHPSHPDPWNSPGIFKHLLGSLFNPMAPIRLHWSQIPDLTGWGLNFIRHSVAHDHRAITDANFKLAHYSTQATLGLYREAGLEFNVATPGTLKLLYTPQQYDEACAMADRLARFGLRYTPLTKDALIEREPALAQMHQAPVGALYFPDDMIGDAHLFCEAVARAAQAKGGVVRYGTHVQKLRVSKGRVIGASVSTNGSDLEDLTGTVILCAGTAAPSLAKSVGVQLPIRPAKGYSITVPAPQGAPRHPVIDPQLHIAVTPLRDKVRVLGMAQFAGIDRHIEPKRLTLLQNVFAKIFPHLARETDWASAENWTGLRPMSSDGRPFIGATGAEGLWVNAGHGHLGWTMAMGSAKLLADQMMGQPTEIDPAPFSLSSHRQDILR